MLWYMNSSKNDYALVSGSVEFRIILSGGREQLADLYCQIRQSHDKLQMHCFKDVNIIQYELDVKELTN
jgi:hypothetical protein